MSVDILRNRNPNAPLGAFDGRVGAMVVINAEPHLITTNTDYIPAMPALTFYNQRHEVYLREDMRYGTDDPTQWPQQYSEKFCHLAAIPTREGLPGHEMIWWNPTRADMVISAATTRLGRLPRHHIGRLSTHVDKLIERADNFIRAGQASPFVTPLIQAMTMALERLQTLPTTWEHALLDLRIVQGTYLEVTALLDWTSVYKPRMAQGQMRGTKSIVPTPVPHCIGAFATQPQQAQDLFYAGLPFWHVRPLFGFVSNNILAVVPLTEPFALNQQQMAGQRVINSGANFEAKIQAMREAAFRTPWYRDPFDDPTPPLPPASQPVAGPSTSPSVESSIVSPLPQPSTSVSAAPGQRYHPYSPAGGKSQRGGSQRGGSQHGGGRQAPTATTVPLNAGRDKYELFPTAEMPDRIPAWADALRKVDRKATKSYRGVDQHYLLPEPALLVSQQDPIRRQQTINTWERLRDFFIHRITGPSDGTPLCLKSQEWREVICDARLDGVAKNRRSMNNKSGRTVATVLGPAMKAYEIDLHGVAESSRFQHRTINEIKEIVWDVAEINFRFELRSLDRRASAKDRGSEVSRCFVGGMLLGIPLSYSKRGLASPYLDERHRYCRRLAILMLDWKTDCLRPSAIQRDLVEEQSWSTEEMEELEKAVTIYYTQSFHEYFGRAAVIPMRLDHIEYHA